VSKSPQRVCTDRQTASVSRRRRETAHGLAHPVLRRHRFAPAAAAVAGCGILIWIFVQMIIIPFSFLQAAYFGAGLLELVLALLLLDVLHPRWPVKA